MLAWILNLDFAGGGTVIPPIVGMSNVSRGGIANRWYGFAENYRYIRRLACLTF